MRGVWRGVHYAFLPFPTPRSWSDHLQAALHNPSTGPDPPPPGVCSLLRSGPPPVVFVSLLAVRSSLVTSMSFHFTLTPVAFIDLPVDPDLLPSDLQPPESSLSQFPLPIFDV